jgi:uncharacterized protein YqjF (DUF2071 family)
MKSPATAQRLAERQRPTGSVAGWMRWTNLLFLHWRWDAAEVQRTLPPGLTVDTFEGTAWLGLVPFFMRDVRPAYCPAVPGVSDFLELNVRTYVYDAQGRPGVWFYSLDCDQWLAVKAARSLFHLNYEHADMSAEIDETGTVDYQVRRRGQTCKSRLVYRMEEKPPAGAAAGTREFFLIERYRLFAHDARRRRLLTGLIWHEPYRITSAHVPMWDDVMLQLDGFASPGRDPDHICAAEPVNVRVFGPEELKVEE